MSIPRGGNAGEDGEASSSKVGDCLEYVADLTAELKQVAERAGFARLGLILMLAEQEARLQKRRSPASGDSSALRG